MRRILPEKSTGAWLSKRSTIVSGTLLYATEFRDFLCSCYNIFPLNLQIHWDVCGTAFGVKHSISCCKVGLVIARHNYFRDKIFYLSQRAFTSASVKIHQGRTISEQEIRQGSDKYKETQGGMMVWGLCDRQVYAIIYVKLDYADSDSYKYERMAALLAWW